LVNRTETGASLANAFFISDEMVRRNLNNDNYVRALYQALFGRTPAANEVSYWSGELGKGASRQSLLTTFMNSAEFGRVLGTLNIPTGISPPTSNLMTTNTAITRVWNLIVQANVNGFSNRPEHIAGIIGNMMNETSSNLCPFQVQVSNHRGLGLMQWTDPLPGPGGRRTNLENYMWSNGISQAEFITEMNKHLTSYCSASNVAHQHPAAFLERVTQVQINFMFHEFRNTSESAYLTYIDWPTNRSGVAGARAYAELFCSMVLRPGADPRPGDIADTGVLNASRASPYVGGVGQLNRISYSGLNERRNSAETVYQQYLNNR